MFVDSNKQIDRERQSFALYNKHSDLRCKSLTPPKGLKWATLHASSVEQAISKVTRF